MFGGALQPFAGCASYERAVFSGTCPCPKRRTKQVARPGRRRTSEPSLSYLNGSERREIGDEGDDEFLSCRIGSSKIAEMALRRGKG